MPVRLPSSADCAPIGTPPRFTEFVKSVKLQLSDVPKPSGALPNSGWRVSNTRNGASSGTTRPVVESTGRPLSRYPSTSTIRCVSPDALYRWMLPSAPTGTMAMLALTWPRRRLVLDVPGCCPAGTAFGVADTKVSALLATAVMFTITPVTFGLAGTMSATVGSTESAPRIGSVSRPSVVRARPAAQPAGVGDERVSRIRPGPTGMNRAPVSAVSG